VVERNVANVFLIMNFFNKIYSIKKKYIIVVLLIFAFFFLYQFIDKKNQSKTDGPIEHWLDDNIFYRFNAAKRIILYKKSFADRFHNSYNEHYLPETQFQKIDFQTKKLNFLQSAKLNYNKKYKNLYPGYLPFFIEIIEDEKILITDAMGNFNLIDKLFGLKEFKYGDTVQIKNNLKIHRILDTLLYEDKLFISYVNLENKCKTFKIAFAKFNIKYLDFNPFYDGKDCKKFIGSGRMQNYKFDNKNGLVFSLSSGIQNRPTNEPQDDSSIFNKISFQDFNSSKPIIFSKGHREAQGLVVVNDLILSTEHGPKGGDEINNIKFLGNYGWPISSYGEKYGKNKKEPSYSLSHLKLGFIEPIYAFIPSIGISEIIKLPNDFSNYWQDNFIITSLNRGSIYRVKFDENFEKLIFKEEIFIGKRIRDIKYFYKNKQIILALENRGELGILSKIDYDIKQ